MERQWDKIVLYKMKYYTGLFIIGGASARYQNATADITSLPLEKSVLDLHYL